MLNYLKSEWLRLVLICVYMVIIVYAAINGNVLAVIGWGTGAAILILGSILSYYYHSFKTKVVEEDGVKVTIRVKN